MRVVTEREQRGHVPVGHEPDVAAGTAVTAVGAAVALVVLALGSWFILEGQLSIGGLVAFLSVMGEVIGPVTALSFMTAIDDPSRTVLVAAERSGPRTDDGGGSIVACCELTGPDSAGTSVLGMFAVDPLRQGSGLGRR